VDERDVRAVEGDEAAKFIVAAEPLAVGQVGGGIDERGALHGTTE